MKIETIDVEATIENTRKLLENDPGVSPVLKGAIELLLALVILMMNQLGLNSQNSSKPPSTDPNREKKKKKAGNRKAGGQKGHTGTTLQKLDDPDHIENIPVDRKSIPKGKYKDVRYESRQIVDIGISRICHRIPGSNP
jgi:transposase